MNELFSLLERQVRFVRRQPGHGLFYSLPGLVDFVRGEPRLCTIVDLMSAEFDSALGSYREGDVRRATELLNLFDENASWTSGIYGQDAGQPLADGDDRLKEPRARLASIVKQAGKRGDSRADRIKVDDSATRTAVDYLRSFLDGLDANRVPLDKKSAYIESVRRLSKIESDHRRAFFSFLRARVGSAGAAWKRLKDTADCFSPQAPALDSDKDLNGWIRETDRYKRQLASADILLGLDGSAGEEFAKARDQTIQDLGTLLEDMALRIGVFLSHKEIVLRFKGRCERFMADALRAEIEANPGSAENILTKAAAQFLYDHGLNPLFDAPIIRLCPDLFDPGLPHALYVEAKQYTAAPKQTIVKASWQVWDTWCELDARHRVREAFLLVFRRSGPLLTLDEAVHLGGRTLHPILVDIAPNDQRGSRAKEQAIHIAAAELCPRQGTPIE